MAARLFGEDQEKQIIDMYETKKMSTNDIAKEFDCSRTGVRNILVRNGVEIRSIAESGSLAREGKTNPKTKKLRNDKTGKIAGELMIVSQVGWETLCTGGNQATWNVICSCGNNIVMNNSNWLNARRKHKLTLDGKGRETWRLHCNDHPHHATDARIGDKLSYLEVIDLTRNKGQLGWSDAQ